VNPYALGRQARKAFDEVWTAVSNLASPTKSFIFDDTMEPSRDAEFAAPQAAYTTVLVVGATGRVGRVLVRKLLLRGYTVKAIVRNRREGLRDDYAALPAAVEVVDGDVGDPAACQEAVRGVNKVCAMHSQC
jgi:NADPH:quinone reductase-like Zn-dependent oxidoreductase